MSAGSALSLKFVFHFFSTGRILRRQSLFKVLFILGFAGLLEFGLGYLFLDGFRFLDRLGGVGLLLVSRLFSLFFLGMGLMLVTSAVVTAYATVFRSEEIPFLLVHPFSIRQIVNYKFLESTGLSSWAYAFVVIPFVSAYAWHEHISPLFALWTFLFSIPFLLLCSGLGTLVAFVVVRWAPRHLSRRGVLLALTLATAAIIWALGRDFYRAALTGDTFNLSTLLPGLALASNKFLPSWWMSEGILTLGREEWFRGFMLLTVMTSTALWLASLVEWLGEAVFYDAWQRSGSSPRRHERLPVLQILHRLLSGLRNDQRAMTAKDLLTFFRDPMQWSQVLVFFGLLGLYFSNLRHFHYDTLMPLWKNLIAFLNVFSVAAVMCSFGARFVYPQLSLEGHAFWILGLSPTTLPRILLTKFLSALVGMLAVSVTLMALSATMLETDGLVMLVSILLAVAISGAISGLSVGLGAIFLDLEQRNPAAIVSGFGGTLNLVLCLGFMLVAIIPFGLIFHLQLIQQLTPAQFRLAFLAACLWLGMVTSATMLVPLWIGTRSLQRREF